ncbi:MAG: YhdP family protein [Hydrogenophaga sp.]|uniref:YhdP family protein n=2 Tax=Hydrogenophaga sp. TaxID=1904254 RepID=UPI0027370AFD|nr:YhdP family protein [Hydrogenophaga sp.]MDP3349031.1 YhdP family protein [Hydrogenophaga sp.]
MVSRLLLWLLLAVWGLFALTWAGLNGAIVPRIGEWRPELERWATEAVGVPVRIGEIRAESGSGGASFLPTLMPSFELRDVQLIDAQGRVALQLPLVRTAMSVQSLWRGGFEQVVIEAPVLDVRRTAQGRIEVAGLDMSGPSHDSQAADWFVAQREFVIRRGTVRWTDDQRRQPTLALGELDFVSRNTTRTHHWRIDATPPPEWGDRLSLRGQLREPLLSLGQRASGQPVWHDWSGEVFADFARVDVARLRAYVDLSDRGVEVRTGEGALRAWAQVERGQVVAVTADLALQNVEAQLGPQLPALALENVQGRLAVQWNAEGFGVTTEDLRFRTREGETWPGGRLLVKHVARSTNQAPSVEVSAEQLDLAALADIAERVPLPAVVRSWLQRLQPAGRMDGFTARWQGPATASADAVEGAIDWTQGSYQARGRVQDLALAGEPSGQMSLSGRFPLPGRPGITGATVDFDLNQSGGRARITVADGSIELPDIFEEARIPLQRLAADASWQLQGDRIEAQLDNMTLANADAEGTAQVKWQTSDPATSPSRSRFPGVIDLTAQLTRADGTRVHRYLPLTVDAEARRYMREAVLAGRASTVDFRIQGDMDRLPFKNAEAPSEFRISAQLGGVDFDYLPTSFQPADAAPWPGLRGFSGQLVLDHLKLNISGGTSGVVGATGVRLSEGAVELDDLARDTTLTVRTRAQGPASAMLGFVQSSPLKTLTGEELAQTTVGGNADLGMTLKLPLFDLNAFTVAGTVAFDGNDLKFHPAAPLLARTRGTLAFTEQGFVVLGGNTRVFGGDMKFEGGLRPNPQGVARLQFRGQGLASAEGLRDGGLGAASSLFRNASGSAAYTAQLGFRGGVPELQVVSTLQGMALNLPAPLGKTADAVLPLRVDSAVLSVDGDVAATDRVALELGSALAPLVSLRYERDITEAVPRVLRGSVAVGLEGGDAAPMPATGVVGNLRLDQLDLDAWSQLAGRAGVRVPTAATLSAIDQDAELAYLPTTLALRTNRLTLEGRSFNRVVVGGSREGTQWRANVTADELNGYVEVRQAGPNTAGSVFARLARLKLEPTAATEVEQLLSQPTSVPALDIAVEELEFGGRRLGRVEVEAVNRGGPTRAGEWRLTKLKFDVPEARFSATGNWAPLSGAAGASAGEQRRTALSFRLDVDDSGALLTRFNRPGLVRGGKGRIEGSVGWIGSPLAPDYPTLSGQLQADFERGQFLKVEPGAGRLLGVLSLQALPRRLALDFRDVFSDGFAFDFVRGDARIEQGVLFTNNLQMKGVNAAVLMEGTADLAREQQDLKVVVVPEINAGTASLIATAINPAIGLGSFLAQFLLRQPLQSAGTQEFRVSGSWADPQVTKVDRTPPAAPARAPAGALQ